MIMVRHARLLHDRATSYIRTMGRKLSSVIIVLAYALVLMPDAGRLPTLVGHYLDHREQSPEMGFMDFLALHYADDRHRENGDETHERLPFHHHHTAGDNYAPSVVLLAAMPVLCAPQVVVSAPVVHGDDDPLAGHRYGLIQPPRG